MEFGDLLLGAADFGRVDVADGRDFGMAFLYEPIEHVNEALAAVAQSEDGDAHPRDGGDAEVKGTAGESGGFDFGGEDFIQRSRFSRAGKPSTPGLLELAAPFPSSPASSRAAFCCRSTTESKDSFLTCSLRPFSAADSLSGFDAEAGDAFFKSNARVTGAIAGADAIVMSDGSMERWRLPLLFVGVCATAEG